MVQFPTQVDGVSYVHTGNIPALGIFEYKINNRLNKTPVLFLDFLCKKFISHYKGVSAFKRTDKTILTALYRYSPDQPNQAAMSVIYNRIEVPQIYFLR